MKKSIILKHQYDEFGRRIPKPAKRSTWTEDLMLFINLTAGSLIVSWMAWHWLHPTIAIPGM